MKIVAIILSIYVLGLTLTPCIGHHDHEHEKQECAEHHDHDNHQEGEEEECPDCSPFCICSCCQSVVIIQEFTFSSFIPKVFIGKTISVVIDDEPMAAYQEPPFLPPIV